MIGEARPASEVVAMATRGVGHIVAAQTISAGNLTQLAYDSFKHSQGDATLQVDVVCFAAKTWREEGRQLPDDLTRLDSEAYEKIMGLVPPSGHSDVDKGLMRANFAVWISLASDILRNNYLGTPLPDAKELKQRAMHYTDEKLAGDTINFAYRLAMHQPETSSTTTLRRFTLPKLIEREIVYQTADDRIRSGDDARASRLLEHFRHVTAKRRNHPSVPLNAFEQMYAKSAAYLDWLLASAPDHPQATQYLTLINAYNKNHPVQEPLRSMHR